MEKSRIEKILKTLLDELIEEKGTQEIQVGKYQISTSEDPVTLESQEPKVEKVEPVYKKPEVKRPTERYHLAEPKTKLVAPGDFERQYEQCRSRGISQRGSYEIAQDRVRAWDEHKDSM